MKWLSSSYQRKTSSKIRASFPRRRESTSTFSQADKWTPVFTGVTVLFFICSLLTTPALAEEFVYAPEGCEFTITLPDEPYLARRCLPDDPSRCNDITSFIHVFGLDATVDFSVTCNPSDKETYDLYNNEFMEIVLSAMMGDQNLSQKEVDFEQRENVKRGVALGAGTEGVSDKLYTAQLWIGQSSVFTVEGKLIGVQVPEADEMFSAILLSIGQIQSIVEEKTDDAASETAGK